MSSLLFASLLGAIAVSHASPSPCPSDTSLIGYSDWMSLRNDMIHGYSDLYTVCPGSRFTLNRNASYHWIYISPAATPFTLQCGLDGRVENKCTIEGGNHHFWFHGPGAKGINIRGLTMSHSHCGSVYFECCDSEATFENCMWEGNTYDYNDCTDGGGGAGAISSFDSILTYKDCHFKK